MEVHPEVFVSNVSTDEWQPDPEVGGEMHVLVEEGTGENKETHKRFTIAFYCSAAFKRVG